MTENDAVNADPSLTDDDLDVEGHGLKEIAAGLSTAAILASGAAGVMHATQGGSGGGSVTAGPASVSIQADPSSTRDVTAQAQDRAQSAASAAAQTGATVAGNAVDAVTNISDPLRTDPVGSTDRLVDQTIHQVRDARDATLNQAQAAAQGAQATAQATGHQAQHEADRTVAQGQQQAISARDAAVKAGSQAQDQVTTTLHATVQQAQATAEAGRALVVSLTHVTASGSVDAMSASGTVTVSDNGVVVGTATVKDGQATIQLTTPVTGSHTLTITYHGDSAHAPSTTTL